MLKFATALLTISTLAAIAIPSHANEGHGTVTQDATSTTVVTGDGNNSRHTSDQRARQQGRNHNNTSVIQRINQSEDTYGHGNDIQIDSRQDVNTRSRSSRQ